MALAKCRVAASGCGNKEPCALSRARLVALPAFPTPHPVPHRPARNRVLPRPFLASASSRACRSGLGSRAADVQPQMPSGWTRGARRSGAPRVNRASIISSEGAPDQALDHGDVALLIELFVQ